MVVTLLKLTSQLVMANLAVHVTIALSHLGLVIIQKGEISNESEIYFIYHYPKPDEISEDQKDYIKSVIYDFETALISANSQNLIDIIDIDSFVDFFIINELSKNPDGYSLVLS